MKRQSYVKANTDTSISLPDEQIITKRINFADIVLSKEDVEAIDKSLEQTDNEGLRAAFRKVQITARKREIYLEQHGYHRCGRCGMHMQSKRDICRPVNMNCIELILRTLRQLLESIRTLNTATVSSLYNVPSQTFAESHAGIYILLLR